MQPNRNQRIINRRLKELRTTMEPQLRQDLLTHAYTIYRTHEILHNDPLSLSEENLRDLVEIILPQKDKRFNDCVEIVRNEIRQLVDLPY